MRTLKIMCLALALAGAGMPAQAQREMKPDMKERLQTKPLDWQGADGFVHFTVPAGWYRNDLAMPKSDPKVVLEVSKGDPVVGQPGVYCTVRMTALGPGVTQEVLNGRVYQGVKEGQLLLAEPRVRKVKDVAVVDGAIKLPDAKDVQMLFSVVRKGNGYFMSTRCRNNEDKVIGPEDLATMRIFFDTLSISD